MDIKFRYRIALSEKIKISMNMTQIGSRTWEFRRNLEDLSLTIIAWLHQNALKIITNEKVIMTKVLCIFEMKSSIFGLSQSELVCNL